MNDHQPRAGHAVAPLPSAFAAHFDVHMLASDASTLVAIDPRGTIIWTNPAWQRFAEANAGMSMLQRFGVRASYFDGIAGVLRDYYARAFTEAIQSGRVFEQRYECSSPERRRLMHLRALPIPEGGLLLVHSQVRTTTLSRSGEPALESSYAGAHGLIRQCSNCRRVQRPGTNEWHWIPDWVQTSHPATSHGICDVCVGFYWRHALLE